MRILHISDLHFGVEVGGERSGAGTPVRSYDIKDQMENLGNITVTKPLDYIFITGDIVDTAAEEAYEKAGRWLTGLSESCGVPAGRIYLCQGSGDRERETEEAYKRYDAFCRSMGLPVYKLDGMENYITGVSVTPYMNVLCLNMGWCKETEAGLHYEKAALQLSQLLKEEKGLTKGRPVIALLHYPAAGKTVEQAEVTPGKRCACDGLCRMADMILADHRYGSKTGCSYQNSAYICKNGAIYQKDAGCCYFDIYEWDEAGTAPMVASTRSVYRFGSIRRGRESEWRKINTHDGKAFRIRMQTGERNGAERKPLQYSFHVFWWTR